MPPVMSRSSAPQRSDRHDLAVALARANLRPQRLRRMLLFALCSADAGVLDFIPGMRWVARSMTDLCLGAMIGNCRDRCCEFELRVGPLRMQRPTTSLWTPAAAGSTWASGTRPALPRRGARPGRSWTCGPRGASVSASCCARRASRTRRSRASASQVPPLTAEPTANVHAAGRMHTLSARLDAQKTCFRRPGVGAKANADRGRRKPHTQHNAPNAETWR